MRRPVIWSVALGLVAIVMLAVSATFYFERPTVLRVAVSSADMTDNGLVAAATKLLKHGHHSIRLKIVSTEGAAASAAALDSGSADLAVVRADVAVPTSGETVVLLHKDAAVLLSPAGSDVQKIDDLAGKRVGMLSSGPGDGRLLDEALSQYDIAPDAVTRVAVTQDGLVAALTSRSIDAVFVVGLVSDGLVPAAVKAVVAAGHGSPVFLPVAEAAAIADRVPVYQSIEIARGAFGGTPPRPSDDIDTLGVQYQLVASATLGQGVVGSLTEFLLSERVALAQIAPVARRMEAPSTDKGGAIPVHPGTAAYIDDEEETFLDRYSDFIYIGAMMLGVMASGMTAIVGRLGAQASVRVEDLVARLLEIFKLSRAATTAGALDALENEVDGIVAAALDQAGLRSLDERRVSALNMAVEQVRSAIRDRRDRLRRGSLWAPNEQTVLSFDSTAPKPIKAVGERPSLEG